jgi:hypothetical protein
MVDTRVFVTSVSASPAGPPRFDNNVFPVVYVADLTARAEIRTAAGTTNLARKVADAIPAPSATTPRFILGDLSDMAFVPNKTVAYAVSRAADTIQRVVWNTDAVTIGSTQNTQINILGDATTGNCFAPIGNVANEAANRLYVNCWVSQRMAVVDLAAQKLLATVESAPAPTAGTDAASQQKGRRFFFTGRGRWSGNAVAGVKGSNPLPNGAIGGEGWSSCGSCHPDGQSDNITWSFATGPRQTISLAGSYSHGPTAQKQRAFNFTAINDEMHDFEANTRNVSGGLGAITTATDLTQCNFGAMGSLTAENQVTINGGLVGSNRALTLAPQNCPHTDWDDINNFVKALRPTRPVSADAASIARGKALFDKGLCVQCHGGPGWTVSRTFYVPDPQGNTDLASAVKNPFTVPATWPGTWTYLSNTTKSAELVIQPIITPLTTDNTGPATTTTIIPLQIACNLRNVGTFGDGIGGDPAVTTALEVNQANAPAQGRGGYNVPSLYDLAITAPYLHHGQAATLEALFTDNRWSFHTAAAFANNQPSMSDAVDLKSYLLSIDSTQLEPKVPVELDGCPNPLQ